MKQTKKPRPSHVSLDTVTWEEISAHEPALNDLLIEARSTKDDGQYFCKHEAYASGHKNHVSFKKRLNQLVGFSAKKHRGFFLATEQAWRVATNTILEALPLCRTCGCVYPDGSFTE